MNKKILLLSIFTSLTFLVFGQKSFIKRTVKKGPLAGGIYFSQTPKGLVLKMSKVQMEEEIRKNGYTPLLVTTRKSWGETLITGIAFWKKPNHFKDLVDIKIETKNNGNQLTLINENTIIEHNTTKSEKASINFVEKKNKAFLYWGGDDNTKGDRTIWTNYLHKRRYSSYPYGDLITYNDDKICELKNYRLYQYENKKPIFSYKMWETWRPYFYSEGKEVDTYDFHKSTRKEYELYIGELMKKDLTQIIESTTIGRLKTLFILTRIQAWYSTINGFESSYSFARKIGDEYYKLALKNEKKFENIDNLRTFMKLLKKLHWRSDVPYESYYKLKESEVDVFIKAELASKMEENKSLLKEKNITLRHTFNQGIIGKDYVPPVTGSYNAGKKYKVGDIEIQEEDYREYVREGGYSKDVEGYTAVYQIINESPDYQLVEVDISCTGKFSDIKRRSWLSQLANWTASNYKTDVEQKDIQQNVTYILKPNASLKDQIIVGEDQPIDFILTIPKIVTVDKVWVDQLDLAISGDDRKLVDLYMNDSKASAWHKKITANKNRIIKNLANEFSQNNINNINASIKIVDDLLFDKDFDSEVDLIIKNLGDIPLMVSYSCPFKTETVKVDANTTFKKRHRIKGIYKSELKVKIKKVAIP